MRESPSGKEQIAEDLQRQLTEFAKMSLEEQKKRLEGLVGHIINVATIDVVSVLVKEKHQQALENAAQNALMTEFIVGGEAINPWGTGRAVVALSQSGHILGALYSPTKELESYGDLTRYALAKAVCQLHLDKAGVKRGIESPEIFDYLASLGLKPFDTLFSGAFTTTYEGGTVYLGGSGCNAEKGYLSGLLGGATPTGDTQSGRFDRIFLQITGRYLSGDLRPPVRPVSEPRELRVLRINN